MNASGRSIRSNLRWAAPAAFVLVILVCAVAAPLVAPYDPLKLDILQRFSGPTWQHLLGTDQFGRDLLSRIMYGARASIEVAIGSAVLATVVGVTLGMLGGYFGRYTEVLTVRVVDIIVAFPPIVLALLIVTLFGPGVVTLIYVIALVYVPVFARITYGAVLEVRTREYVEAARALGVSAARIMFRTILPNVSAPIIVQFSLTVSAAILLESGLSFLGLGVVPPTPSWGGMIADARTYMQQDAIMLLWPCLVLVVTILAINRLSDVLRDRLDPRVWAQISGGSSVDELEAGEAGAEPAVTRLPRDLAGVTHEHH
jgi:peptide/nickel transport system permease protein